MAFRGLYKGASHANIYLRFRPTYPQELFHRIMEFMERKKPPPHQLLIDVGCGSGQGTYGLSSQFDRVIGFDVSKSQIDAANKANTAPNVKFMVSNAENLALADKSVDLVTCAQSAHWFDLTTFYQECHRVLKPRGSLAMFAYSSHWLDHMDSDVKKRLHEYQNIYYEALSPWTQAYNLSEKIDIAKNRYADISLPFEDFTRIMSAVASKDSSLDDTIVDVVFPLFLLLGRAS